MALTTVNSSGIKDDSIVNADIKSDAAIALSKLASTPAVLTGSTNNTITTVTGANAIQGEANLTFDGSTLNVVDGGAIMGGSTDADVLLRLDHEDNTGKAELQLNAFGTAAISLISNFSGTIYQGVENGSFGLSSAHARDINFVTAGLERFRIRSGGDVHVFTHLKIGSNLTTASTAGDDLVIEGSGDRGLSIISGTSSSGNIYFGDSGDTDIGRIAYQHNDNALDFSVNAGSTALRIESNKNVKVLDGDLVIGTAGHGIDFSATGTPLSGSSSNSELFADYERGSWTIGFEYYNTTTSAWTTVPFDNSPDYTSFDYVKCGHLVHVWGYTGGFNVGSAAVNMAARLTGLPYSAVWSAPYYGASCIFTHTSAFGDSSGNVEYVATGYTPYNVAALHPIRPKTDSAACWMDGNKTFMFSATYETAS